MKSGMLLIVWHLGDGSLVMGPIFWVGKAGWEAPSQGTGVST